jgi:Putative zinc-finger
MMQPLRLEQDPVRGQSKRKLKEVSLMKKDCDRTRTALPDYLHGHVYWTTRKRIERHLDHCVVCRSELDTLRRMDETRRLLKYVDTTEGVAHQIKEGISKLTGLKKILYRPLWFAALALVVAGVYYYAMQPRQLDIEIDNIVKNAPVLTSPTSSTAQQPKVNASLPAVNVLKPVPKPHPAPAVAPLRTANVQKPVLQPPPAPDEAPLPVSITPVNETSAIGHINEIIQEHAQLRTLTFSKTHRERSGKLTAEELLAFLERIKNVATVRYDHKRLKSFPPAQQVLFVLTLKAAPETVGQPVPAPEPVQRTENRTSTPAETAAPAPLVTAPTPSTAH